MNGNVSQRLKDSEGGKLYLTATDGRDESTRIANGTDVYISSGETGKLRAAESGWPLYVATFPGQEIPKGKQFTTDRAKAISWLKDLARSVIPSPLKGLLPGGASATLDYVTRWRPVKVKVDAATTLEQARDALYLAQQTAGLRTAAGEVTDAARSPMEGLKFTARESGRVAAEGAKQVAGAAADLGKEVGKGLLDNLPGWAPYAAAGIAGIFLLDAVLSSDGGDDDDEE